MEESTNIEGYVLVGEKQYAWRLDADKKLFICNEEGSEKKKIEIPYKLRIRFKDLDDLSIKYEKLSFEEKRQKRIDQILKTFIFLDVINRNLEYYILDNILNRKEIEPQTLDLKECKLKLDKDYKIEISGKYNFVGTCCPGIILDSPIEQINEAMSKKLRMYFQYVFDIAKVEEESLEQYILKTIKINQSQ